MSPLTTANYADITLYPSQRILTALAWLYVSVACLLLLSPLHSELPVSLTITGLWLLWHEGWHLACQYCQKQGRLLISRQADIDWQQQTWRLQEAKIRTAWLLVLRLQHESEYCWVVIASDSCHLQAYRSLALFAHYADNIGD
ncbi:protein YgfX [Photobacterium nomapromontoriensis]|uniref:protein YgfX n=1 Tax=Photobacterium nomapromontoriensis TaxID=2910237 RepID=UPI003D0EDCC8